MKILITFLFLAVIGITLAAEQRPNILVILSDDHGYADAGFQGSKEIPTPNLDRLAREGMRCTSGYVSHPYCSPTRAGLLTGRYQMRFGHERNPAYIPGNEREGLPVTQTLLPAHLARAGYVTGWIGKWHLGPAPVFYPENRGFQETFGFLGGGHDYIGWEPDAKKEYKMPILRNGKPVAVEKHLTLAFGDEAAAFVNRHTAQPWFLYLAFNAPHTPHQPTPERLARFAHIENKSRRAYVAQVSLLDDAIGQVLDALRDGGQENRTLVFFLSDNGGPTYNAANNGPLRGGKGMTYEGGIRVPYIVRWPGAVPAGQDYDKPVSSLDIFATALACAAVPMPTDKPYDSVNLIPYLSGKEPGPPHQQLFWRETEKSDRRWGIRDGNLKMVWQVRVPDIFNNKLWSYHRDGLSEADWLKHTPEEDPYDLARDLGEKDDLSAKQPEQANRLLRAMEEWGQQAAPLAFGGLDGPDDGPHPKP